MKPQVFSHDFAEGMGGGKTQFVDAWMKEIITFLLFFTMSNTL